MRCLGAERLRFLTFLDGRMGEVVVLGTREDCLLCMGEGLGWCGDEVL